MKSQNFAIVLHEKYELKKIIESFKNYEYVAIIEHDNNHVHVMYRTEHQSNAGAQVKIMKKLLNLEKIHVESIKSYKAYLEYMLHQTHEAIQQNKTKYEKFDYVKGYTRGHNKKMTDREAVEKIFEIWNNSSKSTFQKKIECVETGMPLFKINQIVKFFNLDFKGTGI